MIWSESIISHNAQESISLEAMDEFKRQREILLVIASALYKDDDHRLTRKEVEDYLARHPAQL